MPSLMKVGVLFFFLENNFLILFFIKNLRLSQIKCLSKELILTFSTILNIL